MGDGVESDVGRRWYSYPSFIMGLLSHSAEWSTWRKQVQRSAKGQMSVPKGTLFFDSLVSDYENFYRMTDYNRIMDADVPWDDSPLFVEHPLPLSPSPPPPLLQLRRTGLSTSTTTVADREDQGGDHTPHVTTGQGNSTILGEKTKKELKIPKPVKVPKMQKEVKEKEVKEKKKQVPAVYRKPLNVKSLYWMTRHNLPCIRLKGEPPLNVVENSELGKDKDPEDHFRAQPFCCATYHYEVNVAGAIEELTPDNLKLCTDERTIDFTNALLAFQHWDMCRRNSPADETSLTTESDITAAPIVNTAISSVSKSKSRNGEINTDSSHQKMRLPYDCFSRYIWPDFILFLITHPPNWASWRKKCERLVSVSTSSNKRDGRKEQYLNALIEEQLSLDEEFGGLFESGSSDCHDSRSDRIMNENSDVSRSVATSPVSTAGQMKRSVGIGTLIHLATGVLKMNDGTGGQEKEKKVANFSGNSSSGNIPPKLVGTDSLQALGRGSSSNNHTTTPIGGIRNTPQKPLQRKEDVRSISEGSGIVTPVFPMAGGTTISSSTLEQEKDKEMTSKLLTITGKSGDIVAVAVP